MKKLKKKSLNYIHSIAIILPIIVLFLTIGWSAFNTSMHIDGYANVRVRSEIRVTNFTYVSATNSGQTLYEDYNIDFVTANGRFPNANSTITYEVEITNMQLPQGTKMGIYSMSGLPTGLTLVGNPSGYTLRTPICDDSDPTDCGSGAQKTFTITIGCTSSQYCNQNLHDYAFDVNFDFRSFHNITYSGITGYSTAEIMDGDNLVVNFGANAPSNLTVTGSTTYVLNTDYTYANGVLTINGVSENLSIVGTAGTVTIINNPDGTTTTEIEVVTNNQDGSTTTTTTAVTTDSQGNTVSSSETETTQNTNGTVVSTTTNYDANGDPTTGSTSNTDTSGNVNTQEVTYDNQGNPSVSGYTIDTSGNNSGGEVINNNSLDTGMIVFDGKGFEMSLTFKAKLSENVGNHIFGILQDGTSNKRYSGFVFTVKQAKKNANAQLNLSAGTNSSYNSNTGAVGSFIHSGSKYWGVTTTNSQKVTQYTVTLTYLPANYGTNQTNNPSLTMTMTPITTGNYCNTSPMTSSDFLLSYVPTSLPNATFTLGGSGIISATNMVNFEVISFEVHKI